MQIQIRRKRCSKYSLDLFTHKSHVRIETESPLSDSDSDNYVCGPALPTLETCVWHTFSCMTLHKE